MIILGTWTGIELGISIEETPLQSLSQTATEMKETHNHANVKAAGDSLYKSLAVFVQKQVTCKNPLLVYPLCVVAVMYGCAHLRQLFPSSKPLPIATPQRRGFAIQVAGRPLQVYLFIGPSIC